MSSVTLSRQWGYLEKGHDHNGLLESTRAFGKTVAPLTQAPWLDRVIYKNRLSSYLRPLANMSMALHAGSSIAERFKAMAAGKGEGRKNDFLAEFIDVQSQDETIPQW